MRQRQTAVSIANNCSSNNERVSVQEELVYDLEEREGDSMSSDLVRRNQRRLEKSRNRHRWLERLYKLSACVSG